MRRNVDGQPSLRSQAECHKADKAKLATSQALRHRVVHVYLAEANIWSADDICQLRRLRRLSACHTVQGGGQKLLCNVCVSSFCTGSIAGERASNHFIGC